MGRFEHLLPKMLRLLSEKKQIHYSELAQVCNIALPTASQYAIRLAGKYADNISYYRGRLELKKPLKGVALSREVLEGLVDDMEERALKVKENHIPHIEKALNNSNLETAKKEVKRLKKTLEG